MGSSQENILFFPQLLSKTQFYWRHNLQIVKCPYIKWRTKSRKNQILVLKQGGEKPPVSFWKCLHLFYFSLLSVAWWQGPQVDLQVAFGSSHSRRGWERKTHLKVVLGGWGSFFLYLLDSWLRTSPPPHSAVKTRITEGKKNILIACVHMGNHKNVRLKAARWLKLIHPPTPLSREKG